MAAAVSIAMAGGCSFLNKNNKKKKRMNNVSASATTTLTDPYLTLRVHRGASESEVKKAFRRLALKYHPDVCREDNCNVKFYQINEAYDVVMNNIRESKQVLVEEIEAYCDDPDQLWEEWMGWEGAGIRDYSSHINPYI